MTMIQSLLDQEKCVTIDQNSFESDYNHNNQFQHSGILQQCRSQFNQFQQSLQVPTQMVLNKVINRVASNEKLKQTVTFIKGKTNNLRKSVHDYSEQMLTSAEQNIDRVCDILQQQQEHQHQQQQKSQIKQEIQIQMQDFSQKVAKTEKKENGQIISQYQRVVFLLAKIKKIIIAINLMGLKVPLSILSFIQQGMPSDTFENIMILSEIAKEIAMSQIVQPALSNSKLMISKTYEKGNRMIAEFYSSLTINNLKNVLPFARQKSTYLMSALVTVYQNCRFEFSFDRDFFIKNKDNIIKEIYAVLAFVKDFEYRQKANQLMEAGQSVIGKAQNLALKATPTEFKNQAMILYDRALKQIADAKKHTRDGYEKINQMVVERKNLKNKQMKKKIQ